MAFKADATSVRNALRAGGKEPRTPRSKPTPQPVKIEMLSIRSANAPIVNRTANPLNNINAIVPATSELAAASRTPS